jgi:hypothetical protein
VTMAQTIPRNTPTTAGSSNRIDMLGTFVLKPEEVRRRLAPPVI